MVNNAGVGQDPEVFLDDDLADFDTIMDINLKAVMAGTRDAARHMKSSGGGSIINLTSIGGIQAGGGVMTYRASKAAVIHFTKCAAIELANYEVRVNCLAPGHIRTAIVSKSAHGMDAGGWRSSRRASGRPCGPIGRWAGGLRRRRRGDPLLRGTASPYVTGTVLPVKAGTSAGKPVPKKSRRIFKSIA